jgi:hypothetical protein
MNAHTGVSNRVLAEGMPCRARVFLSEDFSMLDRAGREGMIPRLDGLAIGETATSFFCVASDQAILSTSTFRHRNG